MTDKSTQTDDITRRKQLIRQDMLARRSRLSPQEVDQAFKAVARTLESMLETIDLRDRGQPLQIAVYAAMRNELNLSLAWPLLIARPARLFFPAVGPAGLSLQALPQGLLPQEWLVPGTFGIPEPPQADRSLLLPHLDLILVPGLAFDRQGQRIGWGKAYYDGLLAQLPEQTIRVGVGYAFQILDHLPVSGHDQTLDALLTPDNWYTCGNRLSGVL